MRYTTVNRLGYRGKEIAEELKMKDRESSSDRDKRVGAQHECVSGMIGRSGGKVHRLYISYVDREIKSYHDVQPEMVRIVLYCSSYCGSQRWGQYGSSPLTIVPGRDVTCQKCGMGGAA